MNFFFHNTRLHLSETHLPYLPQSDPQLPRPLHERFKRDFPNSLIFTPCFSDVRHLMAVEGPTPKATSVIPFVMNDMEQQLSAPGAFPDRDLSYLNLESRPPSKDHRLSYLHLAVLLGDLPLAVEALRLGTSLNCKDIDGCSPLIFGCNFLLQSHSQIFPARLHVANEQLLAQVHQVCLFLIAHHSDPNETYGNISALGHACIIRSWDLIRALLLHDATPNRHARMFEGEDRVRFESLVSELSTAARPPRICPCGSERPYKDCHMNSQPYPAEFICRCGSRNIYSACCAKKTDVVCMERWDEEEDGSLKKRRLRKTIHAADLSLDKPGLENAVYTKAPTRGAPYFDAPKLPLLKRLVKNNRIDPAYVAVCKQTKLTLSPAAVRGIPKTEWIKAIKAWNDAVDAYIASGVDVRTPDIIEAEAKLGLAGGPLHCRCEADECTSMESNSTKVFPRCSGCNTAVYCSKGCQNRAWKTHKFACRAGNVQAQMLPSQEAYAAELASVMGS